MHVFGIDGGGTSTRLRIADGRNSAIWEGAGAGINPNASSPELAASRIRDLIASGLKATGLGPSDFAAGCAGVAGADRPDERAWLGSVFRKELGFACPLVLTADPDIALAGALRSPEGLILISGTGSVALARLRDGRRFKAGGLGHFLGDEGSAFWISFQAIARSLRSREARDLPTAMMPDLLGHFGLASPERFIALVYREFDKASIAGAAGLVERHRAEGDPLARDIFDAAVRELVALAISARRSAGDGLAGKKIALRGGAFENNPWLAERVGMGIASALPDIALEPAAETPAFGACLLALDTLGERPR